MNATPAPTPTTQDSLEPLLEPTMRSALTLCIKKRGVELFAVTSSTVSRFFENSFTVASSNELSAK